MYEQGDGPILESRHHEGLQPKRKNPLPIIIAIAFLIVIGVAFLFVSENDNQGKDYIDEAIEAQMDKIDEELLLEETSIDEESFSENVEETVNYFYKEGLLKDDEGDYEGAIEYYTKTIELADKYSHEMWNSLNNRGVIQAGQFENFAEALKDFDKVIDIELNRPDGDIDLPRLSLAYSNRAYVKKSQNKITEACDDLYEALSYSDEKSMTSILEEIAQDCE